MGKVRRKFQKTSRTSVPAWIGEKANQSKWNNQFIGILKRDYKKSDPVISAIVSDTQLADRCATRIRMYVDKRITLGLNAVTKARGVKYTRKLKTAISGIDAAIDLYKINPTRQELVPGLRTIRDDFLQQLGRCKQAFGTKKQGRDRDHAILAECHSFLQRELSRRVTYKTLANLVNAGYETDGGVMPEIVDEEGIRKRLANFNKNNPNWQNELDPRLLPLFFDPETK